MKEELAELRSMLTDIMQLIELLQKQITGHNDILKLMNNYSDSGNEEE